MIRESYYLGIYIGGPSFWGGGGGVLFWDQMNPQVGTTYPLQLEALLRHIWTQTLKPKTLNPTPLSRVPKRTTRSLGGSVEGWIEGFRTVRKKASVGIASKKCRV